MAEAATNAVIVGGVEAVITFVGVFLVGWTLYHTKRAADEAKRAADAARDSVLQSEGFNRQELRAYVGVNMERNQKLFASFDPRVEVIMKNYGQTSARDIVRTMSAGVFPNGTPLENIISLIEIRYGGTLNPGQENTMYHRIHITPEQMQKMRTGDLAVHAWGEVRYRDMIGEWHATQFMRICSTDHLVDGGMFVVAERYNESN